MRRCSLIFEAPQRVAVRKEPMPAPAEGEVRVRTTLSGISAGTERLIYCNEMPADLPADLAIEALRGALTYPLTYGYSVVGRVEAVGKGVAADWLGRRVFAFQPHQSHFTARPDVLIPLPDALRSADAVFLPNMETAVNLVMDARPIVGERCAVFGLGVVGLLTTALLARFPLAQLVGVDPLEARRARAVGLGADSSVSPDQIEWSRLFDAPGDASPDRADLCFELSGNPAALNDAIEAAGFAGRIVVGSWYGKKQAALNLGGRFHRERIHLVSSQVSTLHPIHRGRWTKRRRLQTALGLLQDIKPGTMITHRFPLEGAAEAYEMLVEASDQALQVVFTYDANPE